MMHKMVWLFIAYCKNIDLVHFGYIISYLSIDSRDTYFFLNQCLSKRMFTIVASSFLWLDYVACTKDLSTDDERKNLRCRTTHVRAILCLMRKQEIETRTLLLTDFILVILCHTNTSSSNEDLVGKGFCSSSFQFSYRSSFSVYLKCECRRYQGWK